MDFKVRVERTVNDNIAELQNALLKSVMLLSQQDVNFKEALLTCLCDKTIEKSKM